MKLYVTEIIAYSAFEDTLKTWAGPNVPGISFDDAQLYCENNGLGYCRVMGVLVAEIPADENDKPIWEQMIDYEVTQLN